MIFVKKHNHKTNVTSSLKGIATAAAGVFAGIKIADSIKGSVDKAIGFETAMADVAKVVDDLVDPEKYTKMSNEILGMTAMLPMAANEITQLIAAAGQSGIVADELTRFAEDAAKMGVAFDLPADKAGELAAVIRSSLGLTQDEFVVLADKINYFGNTTTQSADRLIEVVEATGLIGKQAGVNADQIAAMSAAMNGMDAANMGTALSNIYGSLMTGSGATKAASDAWKSLGFTSSQVAKDMLQDSEGTMIKIFEAMQKLPKDQLSATTAAIFGNNKSTKMAIASFTENLDVLKQNFNDIKDIGEDSVFRGSMLKEFNSRAAATENKIQLAKNAIDRFQISLGDLLLPTVADGAIFFGDALNALTGKMPALTKRLEGVGGAVSEKIAPKIPSLVAKLKEIYGFISEKALPVWFEFSNKAAEALRWISTTAMTAFSNIRQTINDNQPVFEKLIGVVMNLKEKLFAAFEHTKPAITWISTEGLPRVAGLFLGIADKAMDIYNRLNEWKAIEPIIAGIVTGFIAFKSAMAVTSTISGITNSVKTLTTALAIQGATMEMSAAKQALAVIGMKAYAVAAGLLKGQLTLQAAVTGMATAAQTAFNIVMAANPIGVVAVGIGALIAVGVLLYKNWDAIKGAAFSLWQGITEAFTGISDGIQIALNGVIDFVTGVFTCNWTKAWQGVQDIFSGTFGALDGLLKTPLNAVIAMNNGAIDGINSLNITVPDWVPEWAGGGKSFSVNIPKMPMLAKGTDYFSGGMAIVGERGPELVNMSRGSQVITNSKTQALIDSIRQIFDSSPTSLSNQGALRFASELDSGGTGGAELRVENNITVMIQGNADKKDIEEGVRAGIEKSLPMTQAQFEKMMRLYELGKKRNGFGGAFS